MTHHELCVLAARWLHRRRPGEPVFVVDGVWTEQPTCPWVTVELICDGGPCHPDVFGWGGTCGFAGVQIEVKISHADFLHDRKKDSAAQPQFDLGYVKYYCCPEGVIRPDELPSWCGLLYEKDGKVSLVKPAGYRSDKARSYELPLVASVMRRLGVKPQIFDFKKEHICKK